MNDRSVQELRLHLGDAALGPLQPPERAVMLDAAEGLLLMRSPDWFEIGELEANVDATLNDLIAARRIHAKTAAEWRKRIAECGPEGATLIAA